MNPQVQAFFEPVTGTISYVVYDTPGGHAAVIDAVLDYDPKAGRTRTASADKIVKFVREQRLKVEWILETHAHADHLSAAQHIKQQLGGKTGIGSHIKKVQLTFRDVFNLGAECNTDGSQFDHLFADGESFQIGPLTAHCMHVPGHTPADMAYVVGDTAFVGDTIFMPDVGTARCDFPGGNADTLYQSISKLLSLPDDTRLYMCHDYPPAGSREPHWQTSVAEQRRSNIHVREGIDQSAFVAMRRKRDAGLEAPVLLLPSIQVNIRAGHLPEPESNGTRYLKIPVNRI